MYNETQKTIQGSTPVSQKQESDAIVGKGSLKHDRWRLEKDMGTLF